MTLLWMLFAANGGTPPAFSPPSNASTATGQSSEIVVTGSRVATRPDDLAANVTVLTRADFDVEKPQQLADVLRDVAGVHVDQVGGRGGTGSIYVRGADPNYTLVLVDGVRVNDPTNARGGSFDFSAFDIADVDRVEIARGPYSAVYGGDALSGVINIVTRHATPEHTRVSFDAMGGAYEQHELALDARGALGDGSWSVGAADSHEGEVTRGNRFDGQRVSASLDQNLGTATSLFVTARYSESDRAGFPDDSGGYGFADIRTPEQRAGHESVFGAGVSTRVGNATFGFSAGLFDHGDRVDSPGVAPGLRDPFGVPPSVVDTDLRRYSATFTGTQKFSDLVSLAYGVDWLREEGSSDGALDFGGGFLLPTSFALTRTSWAPFAELRLATRTGFSAQAGVRLDEPADYGSVTSPRVRIAYEFGDSGLTVAGAWGKAFKLPSLYALGHPLVGNPGLLPERGESHEIELSQQLMAGKMRWSATWFDGEFRNAIDFDPGPPPMLVNRNRVNSHGFEFAGQLALTGEWQLNASVTHSIAEIAGTGQQMRNRPEWSGGASLHWMPAAVLDFSVSATHVGGSLDSSIPTGDVELDAYTRVDASAVWRLSPRFETYLAVDNLTDQQYEQFVGFVSRGIMPRIGVRLSF